VASAILAGPSTAGNAIARALPAAMGVLDDG
jgi:hypothetical protein